ncbi:MAG: hypothetical protein ACLU1X_06955 [Peptoniphilus grossensis]
MVANSIKVSEEEVEAEIAYLEQNPEGKYVENILNKLCLIIL